MTTQPKTLLEYKDFFKRGFQYGGDLFINKLFMPHVPADKWKNFYDTLSGETGAPLCTPTKRQRGRKRHNRGSCRKIEENER
ncbi:hypothetical protein SNEBB_007687 [Seison nebaliae]|nr:hypothetical protein SNEBB_007687 [Seison nebaliae]